MFATTEETREPIAKPSFWRRYVDDVIAVVKVSVVNEMVLEEDEVMVSFDVEALYTSIPID